MLDIENRAYQPTVAELCAFTGTELFYVLCDTMERDYKAIQRVEYSGDRVLLGWNLKFKKAGRTLCTVYPRRGHFSMLLVVGPRERDRVETLLPTLGDEFRRIYDHTPEGMGQRWMIFDFYEHTEAFDDALRVIKIRRETR